MGKILKYCNTCEEGFAERFTFCPVCSASLQSVEVNPVQAAVTEPAAPLEPEAPAFISETAPAIEEPAPTPEEIAYASAPTVEIPAAEVTEAPPIVESTRQVETDGNGYRHETAYMTPKGILFDAEPRYADEVRHTIPAPILSKDDDGYSITVIEEKNVSQRNYLLLGAAGFMLSMAFLAWGVSLFQKSLDVGAIGDERSLAMLLEDVPMPVEEEKPQIKEKDSEAGGGGGGGREEQEETTLGDLANQTEKPLRAPDAKTHRSDEFELKMPVPSTEGNKTFEQKYDNYGDPNGRFRNLSNGPGRGGGIGTGDGTGQGSGTGTGAGSGSGSGYGSGVGNGNGSGRGDGEGGNAPPPVARVSQPLKILYKQKAQYTDAARQNNVQGTVTLRVTFLASGGIGSITTIKGLSYGLTEQAIAAARAMKFEPEKVNGVARTTTRPVSFTFNIY